MITLVCEMCQAKFDVYPSQAKFRRTCSIPCGAALKSREKSGVNHPHYGKSLPGHKHTDETKEKLRASKLGELNPQYGKPAWNSGQQMPQETRERQSQARLGKSPWNKGKPYLQITGENNVNWRGGVTPIHEGIRRSVAYKAWRKAVFERDNYTCVNCGVRGGNLHADHIKPFAVFPDLRFDVDNGRTLCMPCHRETDTYGKGALTYGNSI